MLIFVATASMEAKPLISHRVEWVNVTIECEVDPIFSDLCFCLFRNIFGRLMLIDDVVANNFLFTDSYSLVSSYTTIFF